MSDSKQTDKTKPAHAGVPTAQGRFTTWQKFPPLIADGDSLYNSAFSRIPCLLGCYHFLRYKGKESQNLNQKWQNCRKFAFLQQQINFKWSYLIRAQITHFYQVYWLSLVK